ncbi:haloacid dehalogenase [Arenicella chitinivorans]|uniref:Haloacid dehalogenase n=1 Tax=Arenicella chitinivorans TaxID=1329800 RepID=A0A918RGG5_9GAMM|nr:HAD-IA family hydrolase [Arenicella chitinivorans]GGZ99102.1 haloacid dehalogenase [Arenicella chitinivorans]
MYQLIIFDWDGTLMDSAAKISNCIRAAARDVGLAVPSTHDAQQIIGLGLLEAMQRLFPEASPEQLEALITAYKYHFVTGDVTEQRLFDGVLEGLRYIADSGALLAVATGKSRAGLTRALETTGLGSHFTYTRCADETRSKPHPQMLEEILNFTAVDPNKALMIGDTTFDMEMAAHADIDGLAVSYGVHGASDLGATSALDVVSSFHDVSSWLSSGRLQKVFT